MHRLAVVPQRFLGKAFGVALSAKRSGERSRNPFPFRRPTQVRECAGILLILLFVLRLIAKNRKAMSV
jgi:hypothetical protein